MFVYTLKDTCYAFSTISNWLMPKVLLKFQILNSTFLTSTILPFSRLHTGKQIIHVLAQHLGDSQSLEQKFRNMYRLRCKTNACACAYIASDTRVE